MQLKMVYINVIAKNKLNPFFLYDINGPCYSLSMSFVNPVVALEQNKIDSNHFG